MKRLLLLLVSAVMALGIMAQSDKAESAFNTYVYNEEYQVFLDLCLDGEGVSVPGQDVFGVVPGYFGQEQREAGHRERLWFGRSDRCSYL